MTGELPLVGMWINDSIVLLVMVHVNQYNIPSRPRIPHLVTLSCNLCRRRNCRPCIARSMASAKGFRSALDLSTRPNACSPSLVTALSYSLRPQKRDSPDHIDPSHITFRSILFSQFTNKFTTDVGIRQRYSLANHSCRCGQRLENLSKGIRFIRKTNACRPLTSNPHDLM